MLGDFVFEAGNGTNEDDTEVEVPRRGECPVHDLAGAGIATHRVDGNPHGLA
jgi:hypothetical protein